MEQLYKIPNLPGTFFNRQLNKRKSSPHWLVSQQTARVTLAQVFAEARLLQQNFHIWLGGTLCFECISYFEHPIQFGQSGLATTLDRKKGLYDIPNFEGYFVNTYFECLPVLNSLKLFFLNYLLVRNLTFLSREKDKCQAKAAKKRRARCKMVEKLQMLFQTGAYFIFHNHMQMQENGHLYFEVL